jgi:hypothetical protein
LNCTSCKVPATPGNHIGDPHALDCDICKVPRPPSLHDTLTIGEPHDLDCSKCHGAPPPPTEKPGQTVEVKKKELPKNLRRFKVKEVDITDNSIYDKLAAIDFDEDEEENILEEFSMKKTIKVDVKEVKPKEETKTESKLRHFNQEDDTKIY